MRIRVSAVLLMLLTVLTATRVQAQGNPSQDEMFKALQCPETSRCRGMVPPSQLVPPPAPAPDVPASPPTYPPQAIVSAPSHPGPRVSARPSNGPCSRPTQLAANSTSSSAPSVNLTVQFKTNSAELAPAAMRTLDDLGHVLSRSELAPFRFRIEGHTDTVGNREANRSLSERRAAAVVNYLTNRFGVDPARLEAVGMGEDSLLVPTPPQTPEPCNRRVQIVNLGS